MAAEDQEKHIDPQEIMHELAQCREDERASKSQIFQILSTTATFLTVVTAIFTALNPDNSLFTSSESLYIILYALTIFAASASVSYITNLGLLSTFRHHYMVDLEHKLTLSADSGEGIIHWETVSKPLITLNPKHIGTGIFSLFSINAGIALLSILALAFVFTAMQTFIILNNFPYMAPYVWLALALYALVLLICTGTLLISMYRSKELYFRSLEKAISQNLQRPNHKGVLSYYIYPRPKDVQKVVFIVLGYAMGCVLSCSAGAAVFSWPEFIRGLLVTLLILDGLVYQARYLWNDVRGAHGDQSHPLAKARGRLPVAALGLGPAVSLALTVMFLRLIAAAVCIFLLGPEQWLPLGVSCVLILLLGVRYESVRTRGRTASAKFAAALAQGDAAGGQDGARCANRCARQTIFWVCFGYPLRWLAGLWSAYPMLPRFALEQTNYALSLSLLFFSIAAFGGAFVTMTWILEAVHITQDKSDTADPMAQFYKKPHLLYLLTMLPHRPVAGGASYPGAQHGKVSVEQAVSGLHRSFDPVRPVPVLSAAHLPHGGGPDRLDQPDSHGPEAPLHSRTDSRGSRTGHSSVPRALGHVGCDFFRLPVSVLSGGGAPAPLFDRLHLLPLLQLCPTLLRTGRSPAHAVRAPRTAVDQGNGPSAGPGHHERPGAGKSSEDTEGCGEIEDLSHSITAKYCRGL